MSAMILACIAVLAAVGLALYAVHRKVALKLSARALRQFEVSIEVAFQDGPHHGRLPAEPDDDPRSLSRPGDPTRSDKQTRSDEHKSIPARSPGRSSRRASRRSDRRSDLPGTARHTGRSAAVGCAMDCERLRSGCCTAVFSPSNACSRRPMPGTARGHTRVAAAPPDRRISRWIWMVRPRRLRGSPASSRYLDGTPGPGGP
jgi:hypothetical protein